MADTRTTQSPQGDTSQSSSLTVTFATTGTTLTWDPTFSTILEFAEANSIDPDFGCRDGFCHTCKCALISGEVAYNNPSMVVMPDDGEVLICSSYPVSNVVIDA